MSRLAALRGLMAERGIGAYIVTTGDAHASEYVPDYWRAREWLSGFSGSAGLVVVTADKAGLWTDGRYFIQAERELVDGIDLYKHGEPDVVTYQAFLARELGEGAKIGFDGRTFTAAQFKKLKEKVSGAEFFYDEDLIGLLWENCPTMPAEKAYVHPPRFAGRSVEEKMAEVRAKMKEKDIAAYLVCALDSVAWLFNLRGNDIQNTPLAYAYALITHEAAHIFIDRAKIELDICGVTQHGYDELPLFLAALRTEKIYYNANYTNMLLVRNIACPCEMEEDIISLLKAVKSLREIDNIKNAYIKEGIAMVKFLCGEYVTEGEVGKALQGFRKEQPHYICDSFDTIAAYGANAAEAHYSCGEVGADILPEGFLLVDTGGQYLDGTTDTTRTIAVGALTDEMKRDFTLVLKGNIALSRAVFLKGTTGTGLDILARQYLWRDGQNYRHGTGHGIGYCLSVHEGPHGISQHPSKIALVPGMLVSNEPAVYKQGKYGIRTENILLVSEKMQTDDGVFLAFETLTLCPIDLRAVVVEMLDDGEREWLNWYHGRVFELISPHLGAAAVAWLKEATRMI